MINSLSIDVEDYYQVSALAGQFKYENWDKVSPRVINNTMKLLDVFDRHGVKATHFVLGWVADKSPDLIREIYNRGHEVACHGYSHQLIYNQTPEVFKQETIRSKALLEDIIGSEVIGYRAASYSITKKSLWALDILAEAGFKYDSSIFPVLHDRYGIQGSPTEPHVLKTPSDHLLLEYPLSTYRVLGQTLPIAGGGYFRLYPYWLSRHFYNQTNKKKKSFVFYLHPWEIDPDQPRVKTSLLSTFRHYNNLDVCEERLNKLLSEFKFDTMANNLAKLKFNIDEKNVAINYGA